MRLAYTITEGKYGPNVLIWDEEDPGTLSIPLLPFGAFSFRGGKVLF